MLISIFVAPLPASAAYVVTSFDENHYPTNPENGYGGFAWGDFDFPGAVTDGPSSLSLDIYDRDGLNNVAGGIGVDYPIHRFRPQPGPVGNSLPRAAQQYGHRVSHGLHRRRRPRHHQSPPRHRIRLRLQHRRRHTGSRLADDYQTVQQFRYSGTAFGRDPGDGIQNPGLNQLQLQSVYGSTGRLNVEVDYVKVNSVRRSTAPYPGAEANAPWRAVAAAQIDTLAKPTCMSP